MLVSVIIANYNGLTNNFLPDCLQSLVNQTYKPLEIIVVDNASTDDSVNYVSQNFPDVLLITNRVNVGFCKANNIGFAKAGGEYILFANNDTFFSKACIEELKKAIELQPNIGMVAPKILRPSDDPAKKILDSAGLFLLKNLTLRDRGFGKRDLGQYDKAEFIFAPCGAAAFFRQPVLKTVQQRNSGELWDENFIAYYEDGDLAWRIHQEGWKCLYYPKAIVVHHRGGSSASVFFQKPFVFKVHTIKNRYLMLIKNASLRLILRQSPFFLQEEILIWGYLLFHPGLLIAVMRALFSTVPSSIGKRKTIKPKAGKDSLFVLKIESFV